MKTRFGVIPDDELVVKSIPQNPKQNFPNYMTQYTDNVLDANCAKVCVNYKSGLKKNLNFLNLKYCSIQDICFLRILGTKHKITLPKQINPQLAYLIGYMYGDGGFKDLHRSKIKTGRYEYKMIVGDEFQEQTFRISKLFKEIFNLTSPLRLERIWKGERLYYLNPTCKLVYRVFTKVFELPEGPKKTLHIPKVIKNAQITIRQWFLRGVMDADGDVRAVEHPGAKSINSPRVKIRMSDKQFIKELQQELLTSFCLKLTGPYTDGKNNWHIQGGKKLTIDSHRKQLFYHPIKMWRLAKIVEKMGAGGFELPTTTSSA